MGESGGGAGDLQTLIRRVIKSHSAQHGWCGALRLWASLAMMMIGRCCMSMQVRIVDLTRLWSYLSRKCQEWQQRQKLLQQKLVRPFFALTSSLAARSGESG